MHLPADAFAKGHDSLLMHRLLHRLAQHVVTAFTISNLHAYCIAAGSIAPPHLQVYLDFVGQSAEEVPGLVSHPALHPRLVALGWTGYEIRQLAFTTWAFTRSGAARMAKLALRRCLGKLVLHRCVVASKFS